MGSVRLATTVNAASGQPISIPLSVLQVLLRLLNMIYEMVSVDVCIFSQIPSSGGPVQLIGSVSKATAGAVGSAMTVPQRQNISANTQIVVPANNQNSGSLLAQQQHVSYFLWVFTSFSYEPIP